MDSFTPLKTKNKKKANRLLIFAGIFLIFVSVLVSSILVINNKVGQKPKATCNAPAAGTNFGSPCSTNNTIECGGDGVEAKCQDSTWHATGNCCTQPTLPPASGAKCPNDSNIPIASYVKFTCPNGCFKDTDGIWRCNQNRESSTNPLTLNGACGQVDALSGAATFCGTTEYNCGKPACQPSQQSTPTPTSAPAPTDTPIPTQTPTTPPIITDTPIPTQTPTPTPTRTPTPTPTRTPTPTPTRTPTPTPTTPLGQPTNTTAPTLTSTPTATPTGTPGPSLTSTPTVTPGGPTLTPTEIILAKVSTSPAVVKLLQTGVVQSFMYIIPALIMLVGLML